MKKKIAVLYGGRSGEHEVSLISASSIMRFIDQDLFDVTPIGITHNGAWYLQNAETTMQTAGRGDTVSIQTEEGRRVVCVPGTRTAGGGLRYQDTILELDVAFPVLHGTFGEDGTIQGLLEMTGIPYVGSSVLGSAVGMDKATVKHLWKENDLPVLPFRTVLTAEFRKDPKACTENLVRHILDEWSFPVFVKPSAAGSSVGITRVEKQTGLENALDRASLYDTMIIVEPAVHAREIEVSVIGNEMVRVFSPGEVIPTHEFYDYDAKYLDPDGAALLVPADLTPEQAENAMRLARTAYTVCRAEGFSRVDLFLEHETGRIYINEINTIPGFTQISMFPRMCEAAGLSYPRLITTVIELAIERHTARAGILYDYSEELKKKR
jgi:D-alanine-D-alanine ligase